MQTIKYYDKAMRACVDDTPRWRALNKAAAAIRDGQTVYEPYKRKVLRFIPRRFRARAVRFVRGEFRHD